MSTSSENSAITSPAKTIPQKAGMVDVSRVPLARVSEDSSRLLVVGGISLQNILTSDETPIKVVLLDESRAHPLSNLWQRNTQLEFDTKLPELLDTNTSAEEKLLTDSLEKNNLDLDSVTLTVEQDAHPILIDEINTGLDVTQADYSRGFINSGYETSSQVLAVTTSFDSQRTSSPGAAASVIENMLETKIGSSTLNTPITLSFNNVRLSFSFQNSFTLEYNESLADDNAKVNSDEILHEPIITVGDTFPTEITGDILTVDSTQADEVTLQNFSDTNNAFEAIILEENKHVSFTINNNETQWENNPEIRLNDEIFNIQNIHNIEFLEMGEVIDNSDDETLTVLLESFLDDDMPTMTDAAIAESLKESANNLNTEPAFLMPSAPLPANELFNVIDITLQSNIE